VGPADVAGRVSLPAMRLRRLLPVLLCTLLACAGVRVSQDYDATTDFTAFRTFDWFPGERQLTGEGGIAEPFLEQRIQTAVGRELSARGFEKVTSRTPDFYVNYHVSVQQKLTTSGVNVGYGMGSYGSWGGVGVGMRSNPVRTYDEGTLIIDFVDGGSRKLVWRGTGSKALSSNPTPENTTATVDVAAREILKQFPPDRGQ
jgi:hypothetical protein